MTNGENPVQSFMNSMADAEKMLDGLSRLSDGLFIALDNMFPGQDAVTAKLKTLADTMTDTAHETASTLGFLRNDLKILAQYAEFKARHPDFDDLELTAIIDGNPDMEIKKRLSGRLGGSRIMLHAIGEIKKDWCHTLGNKSYAKTRALLK